MSVAMKDRVLAEAFGTGHSVGRDLMLVVAGVALLVLAAKIRVPMWPVPMTMQTFAVLTIGAGFGLRLGFVTLLAYLALGVAGLSVFAGDAAGLAYVTGPTGGYLVGFAVAAGLMGVLARRGWDRSALGMAGAMLLGTAVIYAFGLAWMAQIFLADKGVAWVVQYGMLNFLAGDAVKLALAALVVPGLWKLTR